ncbi:MAG: hypothetical protein AAF423_11160 [Pseudomonadota bacterium]
MYRELIRISLVSMSLFLTSLWMSSQVAAYTMAEYLSDLRTAKAEHKRLCVKLEPLLKKQRLTENQSQKIADRFSELRVKVNNKVIELATERLNLDHPDAINIAYNYNLTPIFKSENPRVQELIAARNSVHQKLDQFEKTEITPKTTLSAKLVQQVREVENKKMDVSRKLSDIEKRRPPLGTIEQPDPSEVEPEIQNEIGEVNRELSDLIETADSQDFNLGDPVLTDITPDVVERWNKTIQKTVNERLNLDPSDTTFFGGFDGLILPDDPSQGIGVVPKDNSDGTITISNNTISEVGDFGITVDAYGTDQKETAGTGANLYSGEDQLDTTLETGNNGQDSEPPPDRTPDLPFNEQPSIENPESGTITDANNDPVGELLENNPINITENPNRNIVVSNGNDETSDFDKRIKQQHKYFIEIGGGTNLNNTDFVIGTGGGGGIFFQRFGLEAGGFTIDGKVGTTGPFIGPLTWEAFVGGSYGRQNVSGLTNIGVGAFAGTTAAFSGQFDWWSLYLGLGLVAPDFFGKDRGDPGVRVTTGFLRGTLEDDNSGFSSQASHNETNLELFYRIPVSDNKNIQVTPTLIISFNPTDVGTNDPNGGRDDTILQGVIRTTFSF